MALRTPAGHGSLGPTAGIVANDFSLSGVRPAPGPLPAISVRVRTVGDFFGGPGQSSEGGGRCSANASMKLGGAAHLSREDPLRLCTIQRVERSTRGSEDTNPVHR